MRKRREVKVNGRAILTIALVVMLVVSFILAAVKINRETEKYCVNALDDAVKGLANDIKVDMGDYLEQIESIANAIGTYGGASYEDYAMLLSSFASNIAYVFGSYFNFCSLYPKMCTGCPGTALFRNPSCCI